jgi:8-oxo-dGTP pyrophosphatase MutT (NUDIX family)
MSNSVADPRLSATVLIVRDDEKGALEVLMVKRHYQIDFAAGALVFPGGKSNDEDADTGWDALTDGDYGLVQQDARIAAVREAFEESGLLLARPKDERGPGAALVSAEIAEKLAPMRGPVDRREVSFLELIRDNDLVLALDSLIYFGHWITPNMMPKRFDTHFYIAPAPETQLASHDGRETTDTIWTGAQAALDMESLGQATIIFPTRMNLVKLARADSVADAVAKFADQPVVTVLPKIGKTNDGEPCLIIPEEADYGQTIEFMSNIKT